MNSRKLKGCRVQSSKIYEMNPIKDQFGMYRSVINLTFHGIGQPIRDFDPGEEHVWVRADVFLEMLDCIQGNSALSLTFDDGNYSDIAIVLPALLQRKMRAHFFLTADRINTIGNLQTRDLIALSAAGMTIGAHGMHHRSWRKLDKKSLRAEVFDAKDLLEQIIGQPDTTVAFPMGAYDRRSIACVLEAGYQRAYTSDSGPADPSAWLQPRNTVNSWDTKDSLMQIEAEVNAISSSWRRIRELIKRLR